MKVIQIEVEGQLLHLDYQKINYCNADWVEVVNSLFITQAQN